MRKTSAKLIKKDLMKLKFYTENQMRRTGSEKVFIHMKPVVPGICLYTLWRRGHFLWAGLHKPITSN